MPLPADPITAVADAVAVLTDDIAKGPIAGTLSFDEPTLKFTYAASYSSDPHTGSLPGETVSENTTMEPELWFAYNPGDGKGPIYDTTTGARLRSG